MEGKLFFGVSVILVGGGCLRRAQAKGIHSVTLIYFNVQKIWVALEQQWGQAIDPGVPASALNGGSWGGLSALG